MAQDDTRSPTYPSAAGSPRPAGDGSCGAKRCRVQTAMFMCEPHWRMVPSSLRSAITASPDEDSAEYLAVVHAAIDAVAHKESRAGTPRPRPRGKPVQLALFEL